MSLSFMSQSLQDAGWMPKPLCSDNKITGAKVLWTQRHPLPNRVMNDPSPRGQLGGFYKSLKLGCLASPRKRLEKNFKVLISSSKTWENWAISTDHSPGCTDRERLPGPNEKWVLILCLQIWESLEWKSYEWQCFQAGKGLNQRPRESAGSLTF